MSTFKSKPFLTGMFFANLALTILQAVAMAFGADSFYALACHGLAALAAGATLWRGRDVSTARQAKIDGRKRRDTIDAFNPREVMVDVKLTHLEDQAASLGSDIKDAKERAAEREIMRGPHSLWGQAQATIDRIDVELRHMERERIAALPEDERKWALFGGRPPQLTPEEIYEIAPVIRSEPEFVCPRPYAAAWSMEGLKACYPHTWRDGSFERCGENHWHLKRIDRT